MDGEREGEKSEREKRERSAGRRRRRKFGQITKHTQRG
jgi:hypothetical protein